MSDRAQAKRIEDEFVESEPLAADALLLGQPARGRGRLGPNRMLRVLAERASASLQIERTLRAWRRRGG